MKPLKASCLMAIVIIPLFLFAATKPAKAIPVVDQEFAPVQADLYGWIPTVGPTVQTFTVGQAGLLSRVEVFAMLPGEGTDWDWTFQIINTIDGVPQLGATPLTSFTITFTPQSGEWVPSFYGADISSVGIMVTPGQVLGIQCPGGESSGPYYWSGVYATSPYAGGSFYTTGWDGVQYVTDDSDMGFRTFVDADALNPPSEPVPEPATIILLGSGLLGLAGFRKRAGK